MVSAHDPRWSVTSGTRRLGPARRPSRRPTPGTRRPTTGPGSGSNPAATAGDRAAFVAVDVVDPFSLSGGVTPLDAAGTTALSDAH
ncbi:MULTISPECIES: hypothetical protein [Actinoalloteichus]|uniref:hypothetical protein n=1 Tax=Actinoalloteichus TaxID=65496 RepID=UPI0009518C07|nr:MULTISPECIES: hypothetical protein [Actinoalloteichus]